MRTTKNRNHAEAAALSFRALRDAASCTGSEAIPLDTFRMGTPACTSSRWALLACHCSASLAFQINQLHSRLSLVSPRVLLKSEPGSQPSQRFPALATLAAAVGLDALPLHGNRGYRLVLPPCQEKAQAESATKEVNDLVLTSVRPCRLAAVPTALLRNTNKIDFVHRHDMLKMVRTATCASVASAGILQKLAKRSIGMAASCWQARGTSNCVFAIFRRIRIRTSNQLVQ